ncbi:MAG: hypothetical protein KAI73_03785 [Rhodospirillaceae bacterium]|nr:hypothetical protein [Rhodospirillaceae bacterium]
MNRVIDKEMGINKADFLRIIPRALDSHDYQVAGDVVTFVQEGRTFRITHVELSPRKLGGFSIPRADVRLELEGFSDDEATAAVDRFDRYFHRGGG